MSFIIHYIKREKQIIEEKTPKKVEFKNTDKEKDLAPPNKFHNPENNPGENGRFYCPEGYDGLYLCFGIVHWRKERNPTQQGRAVWFSKNSGRCSSDSNLYNEPENVNKCIGHMHAFAIDIWAENPGLSVCVPIRLVYGDYIELWCWTERAWPIETLGHDYINTITEDDDQPTEIRLVRLHEEIGVD